MKDKIEFLNWIINRLIYKHGYDENDHSIFQLREIIKELGKPIEIELSDREFDLVLQKYFVDFHLDKCDDGLGYTFKEREKLRLDMKNLVLDVVNKNVPNSPLIK